MSHLGAGVLLLVLPWPIWAQAALTAGLAVSFVHALRHHVLRRGTGAITGFESDTDGEYSVCYGQGVWIPGRYIDCFRSQWLVIVRLKTDGRRWPITILLGRDAVEPNAFRELRARLHFQVVPQESRL